MTAKEYLNQAREIDALIHSKLRELDYWRDLSRRISGSHFEEQHNPNRPSDAPLPDVSARLMNWSGTSAIWWMNMWICKNR